MTVTLRVSPIPAGWERHRLPPRQRVTCRRRRRNLDGFCPLAFFDHLVMPRVIDRSSRPRRTSAVNRNLICGGLFLLDSRATTRISDPCRRASKMSDEVLIHASSNGDRWFLVRDAADPKRLRVRHQPNCASGGQASLVDVEQFLAEGHGPQHEALKRHLEQLGYLPLTSSLPFVPP